MGGRDPGPLPTLDFLFNEFNERTRSKRAVETYLLQAAQERANREAGKWAGVSIGEWQRRALVAAGIDHATWDPSRGFEANKANIQKIWEGNRTLLRREQSEILPPGYEQIRGLLGGTAITGQISDNTVSPLPGGAPFAALYASGDVTDFEDRWRWIEDHMLPEYRGLGDAHTRALVSQPLEELARREFAAAPQPPR